MRVLSLIAVGAVAATGSWLVHWRSGAGIAHEREIYRTESHDASALAAARVDATFQALYRGLRTMARLPGVRKIGRHGEQFDADAKQTVQELYNNLATSVAMSEVYIVPRGFDPDRVDPVTCALETPSVTFDELIVEGDGAEGHRDAGAEVEEIETYEYRLMRQQLAWFEAHTPDNSKIQGLEVPALCGPEVITCDNSRYSPAHPDDADRRGLVYSVPLFAADGQFHGMVSGVILTHALRDLLPGGGQALRHPLRDYTAGSKDDGVWQTAKAAVSRGIGDDSLIYSEAMPLQVVDAEPGWLLWCGRPDSDFWQQPSVLSAQQMEWMLHGLVALLAGIAAFGVVQFDRRRLAGIVRQRELEQRHQQAEAQRQAMQRQLQTAQSARAATASMADATTALTAATGELADASRSMAASADTAAAEADEVNGAAAGMRQRVETLAASVQELGNSITEIANNAAEAATVAATATEQSATVTNSIETLGASVTRIQGVVELIDDVAAQTNLLALNATIEAARAGEAGKGFAVVAHEVKELAGMTAKATRQIRDEVASIQTGTSDVVAANRGISDTIRSIRERQTSIATAVEQQSAVGTGMGQALHEAAGLAADMARRIDQLAAAATTTRQGVDRTEASTAELVAIVDKLQAARQQLAAASAGD